ncbi:MAG TPA: hypothetical protein VFB68_09515 [Xanthobacteraceae bacterium]|nr:hypothetical protein [Xanthobacteraceae bacterium]
MNLRFAGMITGCMLVGASAAAYSRIDARPAPSGATLASAPTESPTQAATGAPTSAAWPPVTPIAFYGEMFEQLPAATAPVTPAQAETPAAADTPPAAAPRPTATPRIIPLPRAPQTLPALNASGGAGIPQTPPARVTNAATGGQQTPPPVRGTQTPPVRIASVTTTGGAQTPPAGNTSVAATGGAQTPPAADPNAGNGGQPTPQRTGVTPPRENAGMVEIVIRDRYGRPIRVERVERRRVAAARFHQPPPSARIFHSYPQGPHGGYGLYR